jgi:hypothetical protein
MKLAKYLSIAALLVVPFAAPLNAQVLAANVAGSSALWLEAGQGVWAINHCTWTSTASGVTFATDVRPTVGLNENGNLWVGWTTGTAGTCAAPAADAQVFAYINLDSTLGDRCLFAQPSCTLNTTAAAGTAGVNKLGAAFPDTALPANVLATFNGQPVTVAATDILPVDAKFATYSALAVCGPLSSGTQFIGLGYGPGPVGTTINSFYSTKSFHVVDFNVFGNDPITGTAIPAYTVTPVGAAPVVVAVNTLNASGFGSAAVTDVNRAQLGLLFSGIFVRTADILPSSAFAGTAATYFGVTSLIREPLSGTYNTFDHSIPNNKELFRTSDVGNCTNGLQGVTSNPMNLTRTVGTTTGARNRVIGTGEMTAEITAVQDSIGYAFWSAGNFATPTNMKYLTVDGVDPIQNSYTGGTLPTGAALANVTLSHVADGSYPIWSELRLVSTSAAGLAGAQALAGFAQSQVSFGAGATQPDFITANNLNVFHAHFAPAFVNFNATNTASDGPRVCGASSNPEDGGDVGGLVFSLQAGADYCVLKGNYNAAGGVGPTNTASFGSRQ